MDARQIRARVAALLALALLVLAGAGATSCSGDDGDAASTDGSILAITSGSGAASITATAEPSVAATADSPSTPAPTRGPAVHHSMEGARAAIVLDGQLDDWQGVPGLDLLLSSIPEDLLEEPTFGADVTATLKVAFDDTNLYLLVVIADGYDYDPDNSHRSPALAVEWLIDEGAGAAMGSLDPEFKDSGGMVDIWHWEMDCGPGELSGGLFPTGNDPNCNLDDEYATLTDERDDDNSDNSLTGSWEHSGRASGIGADGTFVFEIARPLTTDDSQDVQFQTGSTAQLGIAYWDGNEGREKDGGWTDAGHVTSANDGWIDVSLPD